MIKMMINDYETLIKLRLTGESQGIGRKCAAVPIFPLQILHGLILFDHTWPSVVRAQRV
jgi:hypothetical protein